MGGFGFAETPSKLWPGLLACARSDPELLPIAYSPAGVWLMRMHACLPACERIWMSLNPTTPSTADRSQTNFFLTFEEDDQKRLCHVSAVSGADGHSLSPGIPD